MLKKLFLPLLPLLYAVKAFPAWEMKLEYNPIGTGYGYYIARIVAWDTEDKTPNPSVGCNSSNMCYLSFYDNRGWLFQERFYLPEMNTSKTLGEVGEAFIRRGYLNKRIRSDDYLSSSKDCNSFRYTIALGSQWLPGGEQCRAPEIVPNVCELREPMLELDHGMLRAEVINGSTAEAKLTVSCTYNFNVRVMSSDKSGVVYFNDKKQFRSELKLDGRDAGAGLLLTATPAGKTIKLTSTLMGYDGSVGAFQGAKSIIVSLP